LAAIINAVVPSHRAALTSAPASTSFFYEDGVARAACERERSFAVFIRRVDLRAGGHQHLGGFLIVQIDRPGERRRAVSLRDVHVRPRFDEGFQGFMIAALDGVQ
jgi:hypothetical protein